MALEEVSSVADDGYEKVCKIKSLLAECMVPPRESQFLNLDRYIEEESGVSFIPDPPNWCNISFRGFQERVLTYRPQHWGADPNAVLWFSKYGWRCTEKFVIKCDICSSTVECSSLIQKPDLWGDIAYKAHDNLCYWSFCPCPDRFIQIITHPKILCKNICHNWQKIMLYGMELPKIQPVLLDKMGLNRDILEHLFRLIGSDFSDEGTSALILVICGWLKSSEDKTLECAYCQRHLALRHFFSVAEISVTSDPVPVQDDLNPSSEATKMDISETNADKSLLSETNGDKSLPSETNGDKSLPSETNGDKSLLPETNGDKSLPSETNGDKSLLSETNGDKGLPSETNGDKGLPSETNGDKGLPSETNGDKGLPSETNGDKGLPSETNGNKGLPSEINGDKSLPLEINGDKSFLSETNEDKSLLSETNGDKSFSSDTSEDKSLSSETNEDNSMDNTECKIENVHTLQQRKLTKKSRPAVYISSARYKAHARVCVTKQKFPSFCNMILLRYGIILPKNKGSHKNKKCSRKKCSGNSQIVEHKIMTNETESACEEPTQGRELHYVEMSDSEEHATSPGNNVNKSKLFGDNDIENMEVCHIDKQQEVAGDDSEIQDHNSSMETEGVETASSIQCDSGNTVQPESDSEMIIENSTPQIAELGNSMIESNLPVGEQRTSTPEIEGKGVSSSSVSMQNSLCSKFNEEIPAEDEHGGESSFQKEETETVKIAPVSDSGRIGPNLGKRQLVSDDEQQIEGTKRMKISSDNSSLKKKNLNPVIEHRFWCIWRIKTVDRLLGGPKEGWKQILDILRFGVSPPNSEAVDDTADVFKEVKKIHHMMSGW